MLKKFCSLIICLFLSSVAYAGITQTNNLAVILKEVKQDNKDTVVILDVGDVLLTADDKILNNSIPEAKAMFRKFDQELHSRYGTEKVHELLSIILMNRKAHLVDPGFINLVHEADKHTKGVMCVTTCGVGRFGKMKSWEEWRITELKKLGLSFKSSIFPDANTKELTPYLNAEDSHCNPVCEDGILFVCNVAKANTIEAYFKVIGLNPKKIVFVDEDRKLVEQVADYCSAAKIEYAGFEYTAVKDQAKNAKFNPKVAELQLKTLEKDEVWLSDAQAEKLLQQQSKD